MPSQVPTSLDILNEAVVQCNRCPRLRDYGQKVATLKRRAYLDWDYWGRPVPSFGDAKARVVILGLAPGAHGSNRTGRPFTGDGSGDFLYPVLFETGFASQAKSYSRQDGLVLRDCWITSVVRCAPPDNKPERSELMQCSSFLDWEMDLLKEAKVIVCLGRIAFDGYLNHLLRRQELTTKKGFNFSHGGEFAIARGKSLLCSFHPSLQNTNTGRLTKPMLREVFLRARVLAGIAKGEV